MIKLPSIVHQMEHHNGNPTPQTGYYSGVILYNSNYIRHAKCALANLTRGGRGRTTPEHNLELGVRQTEKFSGSWITQSPKSPILIVRCVSVHIQMNVLSCRGACEMVYHSEHNGVVLAILERLSVWGLPTKGQRLQTNKPFLCVCVFTCWMKW